MERPVAQTRKDLTTTQRVNYQVTETQIIVRGPGCFHVKEKLKERNFAWSKNELHWFLPRGTPENCKEIEEWLISDEIKATNDPRSNSSSPNGSTLELEFPSSAPQLGNCKNPDLPFSVSDVSKLKRRQVMATTVSHDYINAGKVDEEKNKVVIRALKIGKDSNEYMYKIERGNFTLRKYSEHIHRFLKVEFHIKEFRIIEDMITNGFILNNNDEYEFLAYSNSGLRENKCWFWKVDSSAEKLCTAMDLISELGSFGEIADIGKCGARLGQCFSATLSTINVTRNEIEVIPDFTNDKYCFSDGCGRISAEMATRIATSLNLVDEETINNARSCISLVEIGVVPSAFQVRLGGVKGVLAVHPTLPYLKNDRVVHIQVRPSMVKFRTSPGNLTLDVVTWPVAKSGRLNRQFIPLLIDLGIDKSAFVAQLNDNIQNIKEILTDRASAIKKLASRNRTDPFLLECLIAGHDVRDPHIFKGLNVVRLHKVRSLRDKTSIGIRDSCNVIGLVDETGVLQPGQCFFQRKKTSDVSPRVHSGPLLVAKNPSYYKGDMRVLNAVAVPELKHIINCIVFPNHGPRPHPDEIAGSDLDGDQYFVCWDLHLIPSTTVDPLIYSVSPPNSNITDIVVDKPVQITLEQYEGIKKHFISSISDFSVGDISTYHAIWSDLHGSDDKRCVELAQLFSKAIDAPKHGTDSKLKSQIKSFKPDMAQRPDWMGGPRASTSVLGELYRIAKAAYEQMEQEVPDPSFVDPDLLPKNYGAYLAWREWKKINRDPGDLFNNTVVSQETFDFISAIDFAESECKAYGRKMANVLTMDADNSVAKKGHLWDAETRQFIDPRDKMVAKIKALFLAQFEERFKVEGNDAQTRDLRQLGASAYYCYIYLIRRETYTFAWIPLKYLNEVKRAAAHGEGQEEEYVIIPKKILEDILYCKLSAKK
jgi:RNA-dependent RNA polymerase